MPMNEEAQLIILAASVLGAVAYLWRRWCVPGFRAIRSAVQLIEAQLRVNGGSSLMDKVNLIEPHHRIVTGRLDSLDRQSSEIIDRVAALERAQGEMEKS